MRKLFILLALTSFFILSCKKEEIINRNENVKGSIVGTWQLVRYDNDTALLSRVPELPKNNYGFIISENGVFIERKNAGWCGTPPISYDNFSGVWKEEKENLLQIKVDFWGGITQFKMQIVDSTDQILRILYMYPNQQK